MDRAKLLNKISLKKEFSKLTKKDLNLAFSQFERRQTIDEEKIKLTRNLLHKTFGAFGSKKIFSTKLLKERSLEWFLKKHLSTRERLDLYPKIYSSILKHISKKNSLFSIIDLGSGINFFSYPYIQNLGFSPNYLAIESIGQFVDLANHFFKKLNLPGKAIHLSLFDIKKLKEVILAEKRPRLVFLFKVIDSLEMLKRDYSKQLLLEITPLVDLFVLSFPVESMFKKSKFKAQRSWILNFIELQFNVLDKFELAGEKFLIFKNKT